MGEYFSQLRKDTLDGWCEFNRNPSDYLKHASVNLVKDYWDMVASLAAGCAFFDINNEVFGDARVYIVGIGMISGMIGSQRSEWRLIRNACAGLTGGIGLPTIVQEHMPLGAKIANGSITALIAIASLYIDRHRRIKRKEEKISKLEEELQI